MAVSLSPFAGAGWQFFDNNGVILSGGKLYVYAAGTTSSATTYTSVTGSTANTNPIILNSSGRLANEIWLTTGLNYKFILKTSADVLIGTWDNIPAGTTDVADLQAALASSTGAGMIGYTQGSTNAVTTTVQAKLRETVSVKDFGAVGDGVADDTVAIQAAIDSLITGQILTFPAGNYKIIAGLTITNKTRIRLTGKARLFLSGAASGAFLIKLVGTITDLEIDGLTLEGDGNSAYTQQAIGCNSGQTITNTKFHDLNISNINVGISHNANLGGSWTNAWTYNNYLENILGTVTGSGYGIHLAKCYNAHIYDNTINNASRHSIYVASGFGLGAVIHNNIIKNHRKDVYANVGRFAINVTRVSDVTISDNKFYDCYDGQIGIGPDTSTSLDVYNINVIGNTFTGRKNLVGCIWIGEQLMPTSYRAFKISVVANTFDEDATVGGSTIKILNGADITVQSNRFRYYNVAASIPPSVEMGSSSYTSSDSDIENIDVKNNFCTADASVAGSKFAYISNQLCIGNSYYWVKNNSIVNVANEFSFETIPPTNVNSKLKFRTTLINDFVSIAGNTTFGGAYVINGLKPTSMVTIRPQASLSSPMAINAFPHDSNVNSLYVWLCNAKTTAVDWPSQTFVINVEDI